MRALGLRKSLSLCVECSQENIAVDFPVLVSYEVIASPLGDRKCLVKRTGMHNKSLCGTTGVTGSIKTLTKTTSLRKAGVFGVGVGSCM